MKFFDIKNPDIKERILAKNHLAFAFLNQMPIVPGHVLVCPLRHIETSAELEHEEWKALLELKQQICQALQKAVGAEGFNFAWNQGKIAGQTVPHFHLHIVPRLDFDTYKS